MTISVLNQLGFAVLNDTYIEKLLGKDALERAKYTEPDPFDVADLANRLKKYGFESGPKQTGFEFTDEFKAPDLMGSDIYQHFEKMAKSLAGPSQKIIRNNIMRQADLADLPDVKGANLASLVVGHSSQSPWLKLWAGLDGKLMHSYCDVPDSDWLVFDFETFVKGSKHDSPIIGSAIGADSDGTMCYYLWCHDSLVDGRPYKPEYCSIGRQKVLIAHNIAFDGALIKERYELDSLTNWLYCTQAMNMAVSGLDSSQRWAKDLPKKARSDKNINLPGFLKVACGSSLVASYEFHTGKVLPDDAKDPRALFVVAEHIDEIAKELETCLQYALNDVRLTFELFKVLWVKYNYHVPSLTAKIGQNMIANCVLPVRPDWHNWLAKVEQMYQANKNEQKELLNKLADKYHAQWQKGELEPDKDIWLKNLDWRLSSLKTDEPVAKWYENRWLFDEQLDIRAKTDFAHYLLKLKWKGEPIQKSKEEGWHIVKPDGTIERVQHKSQDGSRVGNCLGYYYTKFFEDGTLQSADDEMGKRLCWLIEQNSFYTIMRERVLAINPVPIEHPTTGERILLVAPRVNPCGTISGRTVDNIWLVLASRTAPKPCAELKACVIAPAGYKLVQADIN